MIDSAFSILSEKAPFDILNGPIKCHVMRKVG